MNNIPDKMYFKIGEVGEITGIAPHVLRYWESEFKIIRPIRGSSKQRLYRHIDVENILTIKKLLYEDKFTIPGAKKFLVQKGKKILGEKELLQEIKQELKDIMEFLK